MGHAERPAPLDGWTVGDLVAHLGLGLGMVTEIRPAPPGATALSLAEYVAAYPPASAEISGLTHDLASRLQPDLLAGLDRIADQAWTALEGCHADVVLGRRGPLRRTDYVLSRLIELVVHADDLAAALGRTDPPILPAAEQAVADALRDVYRERVGRSPAPHPTREWVRLAAGRVPATDRQLPLL
jgi:uncharacterized protein (TIGR03083 family)